MKRNEANEGKQRPICACGCEMTYIEYTGYYDSFNFWECKNNNCKTENDFVPDDTVRGAYA